MGVLYRAECCKYCVNSVPAPFGLVRCPRSFSRECRLPHSPFRRCFGFRGRMAETERRVAKYMRAKQKSDEAYRKWHGCASGIKRAFWFLVFTQWNWRINHMPLYEAIQPIKEKTVWQEEQQ
jgi:hypothetical protein